MSTVHFILPWPIDDPLRPSGGNRYGCRVRDGLRARWWRCIEHVVPGEWPQPDPAARARLEGVLARVDDGALVLLDGVMAPSAADALAAAAGRLRLVVLLHMPFGEAFPELADAERRVLAASAGIVTTSGWTARWVGDHFGLAPRRVHIASPGVDPAPLAPANAAGRRFLCVANVSRLKGHDILVDALAALRDLAWQCTFVGAPADVPDFAERLHAAACMAGIEDRLRYTGALSGADLDRAYASADLLVLASRRESYGMVVTEALARGLPVVAADVGGVAEALGRNADGTVPGVLVQPGSPVVLAAALRDWLERPALRVELRRAAVKRRANLAGWSTPIDTIASVLAEVRDDRVRLA